MSSTSINALRDVLQNHESEIREAWINRLKNGVKSDAGSQDQLRRHCHDFLHALVIAVGNEAALNTDARHWDEIRSVITEISSTRARQGSTPSDTATFIFSLKEVLFHQLTTQFEGHAATIASATIHVSALLDKLGLFTIEVFQKSRDQIIARQQQELLELSTPVVKLWQDVLALPLIGTLDSARTQIVMENLLQKIVETGAAIAIIDITGVPTVDTLVAQHLMKTISAARLMGADCIISGIRPQIAQTIVHLGVNLDDVITKATLADAFMVALARTGATITSKTTNTLQKG
jgi:rsbT co-antagonist protein RsbR